jgi:hypothetical protein
MDAKKEKKISFSSSGRRDQKNNKNGGKKQWELIINQNLE